MSFSPERSREPLKNTITMLKQSFLSVASLDLLDLSYLIGRWCPAERDELIVMARGSLSPAYRQAGFLELFVGLPRVGQKLLILSNAMVFFRGSLVFVDENFKSITGGYFKKS